ITDGAQTTSAVTATVGADGTWSVSGIDASGLADGQVTYAAEAADDAGNVLDMTSKDATKLIVPPAVAFTSTPDVTTANEDDVTVTGTGDDGDTIEVTVTDGVDDGID